MVEVFKTNVQEEYHGLELTNLLLQHFPFGKINFDIEDCDKVLRIESHYVNSEHVILLLQEKGFNCERLPD